MRDFLIKLRAAEQAMLDRCQKEGGAEITNLCDIPARVRMLDTLIAEDLGAHPSQLFGDAMERIRQHFDMDSNTPYQGWRGATPKNQPSLPKDIRVVFEQLMLEGVWQGSAPHLDPRWDPSS